MLWRKIEEGGQQLLVIKPRTSGLCSQCSGTELRQPDDYQPPQSPGRQYSIYIEQHIQLLIDQWPLCFSDNLNQVRHLLKWLSISLSRFPKDRDHLMPQLFLHLRMLWQLMQHERSSVGSLHSRKQLGNRLRHGACRFCTQVCTCKCMWRWNINYMHVTETATVVVASNIKDKTMFACYQTC